MGVQDADGGAGFKVADAGQRDVQGGGGGLESRFLVGGGCDQEFVVVATGKAEGESVGSLGFGGEGDGGGVYDGAKASGAGEVA